MKAACIIIETSINATIETVWQQFTNPFDIMNWNNASYDWHTPKATNNLQIGGKFCYTMAAKDDSFSFDFWGVYTSIHIHQHIAYTLGDDRKVTIEFKEDNGAVLVTETFEPENQNPLEMQQQGWQAILNNFKKYVEEGIKNSPIK